VLLGTDGFLQMVWTAVDSAGVDVQPGVNTDVSNSAFFFLAVLVCEHFLMQLFVPQVYASFLEARARDRVMRLRAELAHADGAYVADDEDDSGVLDDSDDGSGDGGAAASTSTPRGGERERERDRAARRARRRRRRRRPHAPSVWIAAAQRRVLDEASNNDVSHKDLVS